MDKTPKNITIIGLVFEGVGFLASIFSGIVLRGIESSVLYDIIASDTTPDELDEVISLFLWLGNMLFWLGIFIGVFFIINLFLFTKLIKGQMTEETAKKVYLYQAIWGGINLLFNQITGILYLVSGVTGYNGHKEEHNIREGI
jgi:hypothetical protein